LSFLFCTILQPYAMKVIICLENVVSKNPIQERLSPIVCVQSSGFLMKMWWWLNNLSWDISQIFMHS
jgi:hypothetical protein